MSSTPAARPGPTTATAPPPETQLSGRARFLGAMFLMATSAVGPGFIVQTTTFTDQLKAAFAFAIVVSILFDIAIQLNVWRVIGVSGRRAQDLANSVLPGAGYALSALDVLGGLVFNIGNIAGCSLGLNAIFGLDVRVGAAISAVVAIGIFLVRRAGVAMDRVVVLLGLVMIALTTIVTIKTRPPLGDALVQTVSPDTASFLVITTLIGGTVGGYIVYAGAHRMVDNGIQGERYVPQITRSSILGVAITGVMRVLLFLAVLGVVEGGAKLGALNPAGDAFKFALGAGGEVVFGIIMWSAAITSVIGASYTSTSFLKVMGPWVTALGAVGGLRVHRRLDDGLPGRRHDPRQAARLRRRLQRPDPPLRPRHPAVDRGPPTRPDGRLPVPGLADRARTRRLGGHASTSAGTH